MLKAPITPDALSEPIIRLCAEISTGLTPLYVEVSAFAGATLNNCFPNVERKIAIDGGVMIIGWSIWESPGLFVEAEFHAVWQSPSGCLVDITPKSTSSSRILFLPQPGAVYTRRQVNNVRRAIGSDPEVEAYLRAHDAMFEFLNRGVRAEQHGVMSIVGKDAMEYDRIVGNIQMYGIRLAKRNKRYDPYLPCWCGSDKKAKWCHKSAAPQ